MSSRGHIALDRLIPATADLLSTDASARLAKRLLQVAQKFGVPYGDVLWPTHDLTWDESRPADRINERNDEQINIGLYFPRLD